MDGGASSTGALPVLNCAERFEVFSGLAPPNEGETLSKEETEGKILAFLKDDLRIDMDGLKSDSELVTTGIIDSADLVRFATYLERTFDIEVADQDISADNFNTVSRSVDYVLARAGG